MRASLLIAVCFALSGCGMERIWTRPVPPDAADPPECHVPCVSLDAKGEAILDWAPWTDGTADQLRTVCDWDKSLASKTAGICEQRRLACSAALQRLRTAGAIK